MFPTVMVVANVASVAVLWFGGHRVESGDMQVGALTAYLAYLMQIVMSVMMGTFMMMMIPRSAVCADRIMGVLDTDTSVARPEEPVTDLPQRGTLELDAVEFSYPGADVPVLRDLSFSVHPGQTVAVIGSTGAGKSTLVNLVPRLFDVTGGSVRIDGVDVRRLAPELLWSLIGLVPQKAYLFSGTVRSNLLHGKPDAREDELWQALEIAQADDFVRAMPEGLDSPITQGGTNVSGGQRQRLAIARAVVRRPEIYLFDDSFSALDLATDARLRAALRPVTRDATVLIVAQRVSTIRDADVILVMEDGVVVGRGTHHELLGQLADVPGDRRVAAERGGGRMSDKPVEKLKETERVQAGPGPGRGPFGGGMVGQKANDFKPSAKRLVRRMGPEKNKAIGVLALAVLSVGLMSLGPRILGRATDLIFAGLMGKNLAAKGGARRHPEGAGRRRPAGPGP